jgi:hypothetical protein
MKIKTIFKSLIASCLFFVASGVIAGGVLAAPRIYFSPDNVTPDDNVDLNINLQIDTENKTAFGADAVINFPSSDMSVRVSNGGFFDTFEYSNSNGKLEIHGYFASTPKSGTGTFAVITLNSPKTSGTGTMSFSCSENLNDTKILDTNGNNFLACSSLNTLNITFTATGYAEPNTCGGTCGSNYNCNAPLYCFNGFCKNPDCPNDFTCGCKATPTPSASVKPKSKVVPTPEIVMLTRATPLPTFKPTVTASPSAQPDMGKEVGIDFKLIGILSGAAAIVLFILSKLLDKKNRPPKITPPTEVPIEPPIVNPPPPQNPPSTF